MANIVANPISQGLILPALTRENAEDFAPSWARLTLKPAKEPTAEEPITKDNLQKFLPTEETRKKITTLLNNLGIEVFHPYSSFEIEVASSNVKMNEIFAGGKVPKVLEEFVTGEFKPFTSTKLVPGTFHVVFPK